MHTNITENDAIALNKLSPSSKNQNLNEEAYKVFGDSAQLENDVPKDSNFSISDDIEVNPDVDEIVEDNYVNQLVISQLKNNQVEKITDSILDLLISQLTGGIITCR